MTISLSDAGKRFNRDWIFRHFNYTFESGQSYAITGPNGSGKSTLLQVLSGAMMVSEGTLKYEASGEWRVASGKTSSRPLTSDSGLQDSIYKDVSICAPYLELIEEMTLSEFLEFHQNFKPLLENISVPAIIQQIGLENAGNKQIRYFSSGMKQRAKLAQCIFSNTDIVLLDEPCTNLDTAGVELYHSLIEQYCQNRLVIVSSNDEVEYNFCNERISMSNLKM